MGSQTLDNLTFKQFIDSSLTPLINDLRQECGAKFVYKTKEEENIYWNDVKTSIDKGETWL